MTSSETTGSSDILEYLLTTPTVAARQVGGVAGLSVLDLAISEDGREIAAGVGRQPLNTVETPDSPPELPWKMDGSGGSIDCQWLYYTFPKGAPALPSPSPVIPAKNGLAPRLPRASRTWIAHSPLSRSSRPTRSPAERRSAGSPAEAGGELGPRGGPDRVYTRPPSRTRTSGSMFG